MEAVPVHGKADGDGPVGEAQLVQRADGVAGLEDPHAVDVPLGVALHHVDRDAAVAQGDGGRQAPDAAPDDQHTRGGAHVVNNPETSLVSAERSTVGKDSIIVSGIATLR